MEQLPWKSMGPSLNNEYKLYFLCSDFVILYDVTHSI